MCIYLFSYSRSLAQGDDVTHQIASDADSRGNFTRYGKLNGQQSLGIRPISDNFVFAISRDLGAIQATDPVVWAIGYTTDSAINYTDLSGALPISRSLYYKIQSSNDKELASIYGNARRDDIFNIKGQIVDFLNDYSNASALAGQWENVIAQDSHNVTDNLIDLTSIALAEVYGSMQLTVRTDEHGNPDKSDVMMLMKNTGGVKKK